MSRPRYTLLGALAWLALISHGGAARAGDFLDDGSFVFDGAAVARFDFEQGAPEPLEEGEPPLEIVTTDALSGSHAVSIGSFQFGGILLDVPPEKRSYRASVWLRGGEALGRVYLAREGSYNHGGAALYPTGRVTSDGWYELANGSIRVDGARSAVVFGVFNHDSTPVEMDAVELTLEGSIDGVVNPSCAGAVDSAACSPSQICIWSECVDVNPWVPPLPSDRDTVASYLRQRLSYLYGPYQERALDLPGALDAMAVMDVATEPWTYWNGFLLAIRRLHDWHTVVSGVGVQLTNPRPIDVCFIEGDGDLSQAEAPTDPLYRDLIVSHVGTEGETLGLVAGDRLVRVDGMHPTAWARTLIEFLPSQPVTSNRDTFPDMAADLRRLISAFAQQIEVVRCDPQSVSCGALETIVIADLPEIDQTIDVGLVACDNRPLRHLSDSPANHGGSSNTVYAGLLLESDANEKIYGAEWSSLSTTNGNNGVGASLTAAVQLFKSEAAGVILDHRYGTGGTLAGPKIIWDWAVATHPISYMQGRPFADTKPPTQAEGVAFFQAALSNGEVDFAGAGSPTSMPVALLITQDGSASDWLALGLKGAPNVRIFGPYQTNGAFSTRYELGYTLGMGYVLASADTFIADGNTINGTGVEPDVTVLPKQSDLLVGIDSVFDAALTWVRQELP